MYQALFFPSRAKEARKQKKKGKKITPDLRLGFHVRYLTAWGKSSVVLRHDSTGWVNVFVSFMTEIPSRQVIKSRAEITI